MCRVYLNRQYFLNTCFFPLILLPLLFIRSIYDYIGQDPAVADLATQYVHTVLPGLYLFFQGQLISRYASAHKYMSVQLFVMLGASIVHILLVLLMVNYLQWGFTGICIASCCQFISRWAIANFQVNFYWPELREKHGTKIFSKESTENLGRQISIGVWGMFMGVWGWWAFDIFTLMASYLSLTSISA